MAMAVGSQMSALKNVEEVETYRVVRMENPHGIVIANLRKRSHIDDAIRAVEMIEADALQIHLNVIQELSYA